MPNKPENKVGKKPGSKGRGAGIAIGAAGLAAAAVGAYWLYGSKHAKKHRNLAASWMLKARAEVMDAVSKLKDIDRETYYRIVDDVTKRYAKLSKSNADLATIKSELKAAWAHMQSAAKPVQKKAKKVVNKVVKAVE